MTFQEWWSKTGLTPIIRSARDYAQVGWNAAMAESRAEIERLTVNRDDWKGIACIAQDVAEKLQAELTTLRERETGLREALQTAIGDCLNKGVSGRWKCRMCGFGEKDAAEAWHFTHKQECPYTILHFAALAATEPGDANGKT